MTLLTESYLAQKSRWPTAGRVILAQFDADSVVVYQAYRPEIGKFAANNGYFGGEFKFGRMSWIKPNFLWMMFRSGWAAKEGQEVILAIWLQRSAFDRILREAVYSTYQPDVYASCHAWQQAVAQSNVRLQWDPDHDPMGNKLERRAIQLGLRSQTLKSYSRDWILEIEDVSEFVRQQSVNARPSYYRELMLPSETVYPVADEEIAAKLRLNIDEQA